MKKLLLVSSIAMMCIFGISAAAEGTYTTGESRYTDSAIDGAKTVVIYKGSSINDLVADDLTANDDNIYYVDQSDTTGGFSNFSALLRANTPAGDYIVATDTKDEAAKFTVTKGQSRVSGLAKMEFLDAQKQSNDDTKYSIAFTVISEDGFDISTSKLIMLYDDTTYETNLFGDNSIITWGEDGTKLPNIDSKTKCAIQFDYVAPEYMTVTDTGATPNFTMYFEK